MNLPSTTLASNPVARSSIAGTSTSVTPRCSMRNSAWPVKERSQFHHSGKVGIEPLGGPIVAPGHTRISEDTSYRRSCNVVGTSTRHRYRDGVGRNLYGRAHLKCRLANAQPDPDFRYRSKLMARASSANCTTRSICQGRPCNV